jgi:hypothetical protein
MGLRNKQCQLAVSLVVVCIVLLCYQPFVRPLLTEEETLALGPWNRPCKGQSKDSPRYMISDHFLTDDGFGSAVQKIKVVLIISQVLGFKLVVNPFWTSHQYSVSEVVNNAPLVGLAVDEERALPQLPPRNGSVCFLTPEDCDSYNCTMLVDSVCEREAGRDIMPTAIAGLNRIKNEYGSCEMIVEMVTAHTGWFEQWNACLSTWYHAAFGEAIARKNISLATYNGYSGPTIGVNIRWGDLAAGSLDEVDERTMSWADANAGVAFARKALPGAQVYLFIKGFEERMRERLDFGFTLINTGDDLVDLMIWSQMKVKVQKAASWGVVGTYINGKTVVLSSDPSNLKWLNSEDARVHVFDVRDPPPVERLVEVLEAIKKA